MALSAVNETFVRIKNEVGIARSPQGYIPHSYFIHLRPLGYFTTTGEYSTLFYVVSSAEMGQWLWCVSPLILIAVDSPRSVLLQWSFRLVVETPVFILM
jgi:hypothetical protein